MRKWADRLSREKIIIGCSRAGSLNNPTALHAIEAMWCDAVAAGITRFDTANIYAQGDSERALGRLLARHDGLEIITKAGYDFRCTAQLIRLLKPVIRPLLAYRRSSSVIKQVRGTLDAQDFCPAALAASIAGSRRRLGRTPLSAVLLHDPGPRVLFHPRTGEYLTELKVSGQVEQVGVSIAEAECLLAVAALPTLDIVQMPVMMFERLAHGKLVAGLLERGVRIYLRQVMQRGDGTVAALELALPRLLENSKVDGIVIGLSRQGNLDHLLKHVPA